MRWKSFLPRRPDVAGASLLALLSLAACGHVIRPELSPNLGRFDFSHPPCRPSPKPQLAPDEVGIRYLGAGGLYVEWQGTALLASPFFSNPGLLKVPFGRLAIDEGAVEHGLAGMDLSRVRAAMAGHSHYDHLGDLPLLAERYAPGAWVYVNETGAHALAPVRALTGRITPLEGEKGWIYLRDPDANPLPIRFRKVESAHAPHFWGIHLARGSIARDWTGDWQSHRLLALREGHTFAFVIDLLSARGEPRFRIYYQDAMSPPGQGIPHLEPGDDHPYDLAVLCMASYAYVRDQPQAILGHLHPRHVLVTHYEDFFRAGDRPVRFVPLLTDGSANRFLARVGQAMKGLETIPPEGPVCGPASPASTMPIPGEWVRFRVPAGAAGADRGVETATAPPADGAVVVPVYRPSDDGGTSPLSRR